MRTSLRTVLFGVAALYAALAQASQPVFTILGGGYGSLTQATNGSLYGVPLNAMWINSITPPASPGGDWTTTTIYTFSGGSDGTMASGLLAGPVGPVGLDVLYGTTPDGGSSNLGTVFSLTPPQSPGGAWTKAVLHSFSGGSDPGNPGALTLAADGVLYGVTEGLTETGPSTVFSLTPPASPGGPWVEVVLYTFYNSGEQGPPLGPLVVGAGASPVLYGTTINGGTYGNGSVYSLEPPATGSGSWSESVLYSFTGLNDGGTPGPLIPGKHGTLYGTAFFGGAGGFGAVFSLTPPSQAGGPWTETVLYSAGINGGPNALALATNGRLYASSEGCCYTSGEILSLTPPTSPGGTWTARDLHTFGKEQGGVHPYILPRLWEGDLYGTTTSDGASLFSLAP